MKEPDYGLKYRKAVYYCSCFNSMVWKVEIILLFSGLFLLPALRVHQTTGEGENII
ncbi:hypothetical protein KIS4809_1269 [Bacillus sp. ZZV12-4809]|nr:hypothetical protein KIS4809_1269 [Bacillus sp. ZZV12-4809]